MSQFDFNQGGLILLNNKGIVISTSENSGIYFWNFIYYDYIIAMEDYNVRNLQRLLGDSEKYSLLLDYTETPGNISDPWYSGDFETAFQDILKGCEAMLK